MVEPSVARRAVDPLADLEPLGVEESVAGLVGDGEVRGPRRREAAALGAEDDVLEAELARRAVGARRRAGGRCSTTTRSAGRAGRRRVAARRGADPRRRPVGPSARRSMAAGRGGLARIGGPPAVQPASEAPTTRVARTTASDRLTVPPPLRLRPRPPTRAGGWPRTARAGPASTSSSARAVASSLAPAARGRPSRRGPRRSRRQGPAP